MRRLFSLILLMICTTPVWADNLDQLYKAAGWPDQRAHFNDALTAAQARYRNSLPPAVYQALVNNSNQRFQAQAVDRRAQAQLRATLANPAPALAFFRSPLGRKVVAAELKATRKDELARNAKGLPKIQASDDRLLIIGHLAQALPARLLAWVVSCRITVTASPTR